MLFRSAGCKLPFCNNCLVTIQGQTLCGPCKNFRIAGMGRTTRLLPLSVLALVVSLVSGPVMLILSLLAVSLYLSEGLEAVGAAIALCLMALVMPVAGLALAVMALRRLEKRPEIRSESLMRWSTFTSKRWSLLVLPLVPIQLLNGLYCAVPTATLGSGKYCIILNATGSMRLPGLAGS